ncbi:BrnT family toxin [Pusillimonas sp.]|uniref:BrnT family toxin n=1 Tax=Pusillimonas sp. TaxID=3040095 RepID=UPI0029B9D3A9|nr:BrnT family toxin [Pusillimonas sp.]MDX3894952.1 BrnT family toxin [Pusillimonas sp.]
MKITYDCFKRAKTLETRGLDMRRADEVFFRLHFTLPDERVYPELRFITIGALDGCMVVLVWTPRGDARRIISMRKANSREQTKYAQYLGRSR